MYVDIVVDLPVEGPFTYEVPQGFADIVAVGKRVWAPFGNRRVIGYIVGLKDKTDIKGIRPIHSVLDEQPVLGDDLLKTTKWVSEYYFCSWGEAIEAALPPALKKGRVDVKPRKSVTDEKIQPSHNLKPTMEQDRALKVLYEDIDSARRSVCLLHGVTGSGKTEVYLQAIAKVRQKGRSSIVLVPEISLTPQTIERFKARFKDDVAILHSHLTDAMRFIEWKRVRDGSANIVVGARSAVFAPVKDLGLVVIDEEHETSYKQQDAPRYHAREVAIKRAEISGAVVILGSATPSLESYYKAKQAEFKLLNLKQRIEDKKLPTVRIIDMRQHIDFSRRQAIFSRPMQDGIKKVLANHQQAILFLNRRGFATFMSCKKCGFVLKCKSCDITLTYHFQDRELVCHWCNHRQAPPDVCPRCKSSYINYFGIGTEKVESEMNRLFASAAISRMDTDVTRKRNSHREILDRFKNGQTRLLVGTQMIAKGLDFPKVTLVGVVSADTALHIPDFRCGERTFNLLTQVAGRAGRGQAPGEVLIQTFTPQHYAITCASKHDYDAFFNREIEYRKQLQLPPYMHLVVVTFRSKRQEAAVKSAQGLAKLLKENIADGRQRHLKVIGPAIAATFRLRKEYRWNVILKAKRPEDAVNLLKKGLARFKKPSGVRMAVDVDPL